VLQKTRTTVPGVFHDEKPAFDIEQASGLAPMDPNALKNNALSYHLETIKTAEETLAECRFVRKIDFLLLPLVAII
jgi:hypothetical protein